MRCATLDALVVEAASGTPLLRGVSLTLEPGRSLVLLGASGAGKTTVVRAMLDQLPPGLVRRDGRFLWDGEDFFKMESPSQRRILGRSLGWVPQEPGRALHPLRRIEDQVAEVVQVHLGWTWKACRRRARLALGEAEFPSGRLRAVPAHLSGGEQRRAALALAFVLQPEVVLMDEPTTGLDAATAQRCVEWLQLRVARGCAALVVSHDLNLAHRLGDQVAFLAGGVVSETGGTDILAQPRTSHLALFLGMEPAAVQPRTQ